MLLFNKKPKITSEEQLRQSISQAFGGISLWNLCRGNFDFFVNAIRDGSPLIITAALKKIDKYSTENLNNMLYIHNKYKDTK